MIYPDESRYIYTKVDRYLVSKQHRLKKCRAAMVKFGIKDEEVWSGVNNVLRDIGQVETMYGRLQLIMQQHPMGEEVESDVLWVCQKLRDYDNMMTTHLLALEDTIKKRITLKNGSTKTS